MNEATAYGMPLCAGAAPVTVDGARSEGMSARRRITVPSQTDVIDDQVETFRVDEHSGVPIWLQIRKRLVYLITSHKYECGERLPSVREMSVKLGVNYNTVNKVYQDLERDGYIVTMRGKGSYVADVSAVSHTVNQGEIEALAFDFVQYALANGMGPGDVIELVERQIDSLERARRV